jgi:hypothetical protein
LEPKPSDKRFVLSWQERIHNRQRQVQVFRNRSLVQELHSHNRQPKHNRYRPKMYRNQQQLLPLQFGTSPYPWCTSSSS